MWGGSLALYLVVLWTRCLLETAVFEVDASLKWIPRQSKHKALIVQKRKKKIELINTRMPRVTSR